MPLDLETTESVDCGSYRRDRVVFDTEATMSVPAYLLVPHDRTEPGPAILAIHGHGPGKARICGVLDEEHDEGAPYAHVLASEGYVVLAPDLRGFGERADWMPDDKYHCDWDLVCATMAGVVPHQRNLWDLQRSLDVLAAHPLVDPTRIGAGGLSYGATCTLFLAAIDERVRAAIVACYLSSWRSAHTIPWNMCGSQILPGQIGAIEHLDVASLIAPRALLAENGIEDFIFPVDAARETVASLRRVYAQLGAPADALVHDVFDGWPHVARHRDARRSWRGGCDASPTGSPSSASTLPGPFPPHDPLDAVVVHGGRARTSGQLPRNHEGVLVHPGAARRRPDRRSRVRRPARWCALNALSVLQAELGDLDRIERVLTVLGFVASRARVRATARGRRRREPAARRRVRRRRAPQPLRDRCGRAAARRRGRDRGRGRAPANGGGGP